VLPSPLVVKLEPVLLRRS